MRQAPRPWNFSGKNTRVGWDALLRLTQQTGEVILKENEQPRYRLIDMEQVTEIEMTDDEKIDFVAARILKKYRRAFEELAK